MRSRRVTLLLIGLTIVGCAGSEAGDGESAPAAAEPPAAAEAPRSPVEIVAEGVVSTATNQTFPVLDPVTGDLWLSEYEGSFAAQTISFATASGDTWSAPVVAPFSGEWGDRAPRFSPDGGRLYFTSNRPLPGETEPGDMNVWRVERTESGWSDPEPLPAPFNSDAEDIHPSVTADAIWLASNRAGGFGRSDLYRIAWDGTVEHLPAPVNDELSQPDVWVSPDESWMILAVTDHPSGLGGDDLYLSRRTEDGWSAPEHLGSEVNTAEYEYGPFVTPDGRDLYFTSHRAGASHVYRVPLAAVLGG